MTKHGSALLRQLEKGLNACEKKEFPLPGVNDPVMRDVFLKQLVDSIRRVKFVSVVAGRDIHPDRGEGLSDMFDPIRASLLQLRDGDLDEACWLAFLFVHFGRHPVSGYRYTREVYSALGRGDPWTFEKVSKDPKALRTWLDRNAEQLARGKGRGFGNHRKYLSLSGSVKNGTGDAFESYVQWVARYGGHAQLFQAAYDESDGTPEGAFEWLYQQMKSVRSYGRIGRFDYLTMLQKLRLANIRPGRPYLDHSTKGPNKGARRMFDQDEPLMLPELERRTQVLGHYLKAGMQEMEDSLCNWGKNPSVYKYFRG
jgi:hypothetical protein